MKKRRNSNFELMRIISMIFVVMWHLILHSNLYNTAGVTKFFLEFLILLGVVHINSFVIITGYFQCEQKFSWKKFFKTFSLTWFYKALFAIIFFVMFPGLISKIELFKELMPLDFRDYWYINCYLLLYLLSPFLNKLINSLNQKDHRKMLILLFIVFALIPLISNQAIVKNDGYTIVQFCFMYLVGSYLKKYPLDKNIHFKNYSKNKKQILCLSISFGAFFINFLLLNFSKTIITLDSSFLNGVGKYLFNNSRLYSNPLVIIQSVFYFLFFSTMTFKSRKINFIARFTLDVYLIHENYYIMQYLYNCMQIDKILKLNGCKIFLIVIMVSIMIFTACIIIGIIRNLCFKLIDKLKINQKFKCKVINYVKEI